MPIPIPTHESTRRFCLLSDCNVRAVTSSAVFEFFRSLAHSHFSLAIIYTNSKVRVEMLVSVVSCMRDAVVSCVRDAVVVQMRSYCI